jgi:hypothetical protein
MARRAGRPGQSSGAFSKGESQPGLLLGRYKGTAERRTGRLGFLAA